MKKKKFPLSPIRETQQIKVRTWEIKAGEQSQLQTFKINKSFTDIQKGFNQEIVEPKQKISNFNVQIKTIHNDVSHQYSHR